MFEREDVGDVPPYDPGPAGPIEKFIGSLFMAAITGVFTIMMYEYFGVKGALLLLAAILGIQQYFLNSLYSTYKRDHYDDIRQDG